MLKMRRSQDFLTWESPYLGKKVLILRRGPGSLFVCIGVTHWGLIYNAIPNQTFFKNLKINLYHMKVGWTNNKANLRDLIAATGLVILFRIGLKSSIFFAYVTLQFDRWPWQKIGHLFYTTISIVHHFKAIGEFKIELQSGNAQFGSK